MKIHVPFLTLAAMLAVGTLAGEARAQHAHVLADNGIAAETAAAKAEHLPPPFPELRTAPTARDQAAAIALAESIAIQESCRYPVPALWYETIGWYQGSHAWTGFNYHAKFTDKVLQAHARLAVDYLPKANRCAAGGSQVLGDEAAARLQRSAYDPYDSRID